MRRLIGVNIFCEGMLSIQNCDTPFPRPRRRVVRLVRHLWTFDPRQAQVVTVVERRWPGVRLRYGIWQN